MAGSLRFQPGWFYPLWSLAGIAGLANLVLPGMPLGALLLWHVSATALLVRLLIVVHELGHVVAGGLTGIRSTGIELGEGAVRWRGSILGMPIVLRHHLSTGLARFEKLPVLGPRGPLALLYAGGPAAVLFVGLASTAWSVWRHGAVWPTGLNSVHLSQVTTFAAAWLTIACLFPGYQSHPSLIAPVPSDGQALWRLARNIPICLIPPPTNRSRWERKTEIAVGILLLLILPLWIAGIGLGVWLLTQSAPSPGSRSPWPILPATLVTLAFSGIAAVTATIARRLLRRRPTPPNSAATLQAAWHAEESQETLSLFKSLPMHSQQPALDAFQGSDQPADIQAAETLLRESPPSPFREWLHAQWWLRHDNQPAALHCLESILSDTTASPALVRQTTTLAWSLRVALAGAWSPELRSAADAWVFSLSPDEQIGVLDIWLSNALLDPTAWPGRETALRWADSLVAHSPEPTLFGTTGSVHIAAGNLEVGKSHLHSCLTKTHSDLDRAISHQFLAWAAAQEGDTTTTIAHTDQARHHGLAGRWLDLLESWETDGYPPART